MKVIKVMDKHQRWEYLRTATMLFILGLIVVIARFGCGYTPSESTMNVGVAATLPYLAQRIGDDQICVGVASILFSLGIFAGFNAFFEVKPDTITE